MTVNLTAKQAKALGINATDAAPSSTRKPRKPRAPYATVCHDCGERFDTQASETRHLNETRHCRYALELAHG